MHHLLLGVLCLPASTRYETALNSHGWMNGKISKRWNEWMNDTSPDCKRVCVSQLWQVKIIFVKWLSFPCRMSWWAGNKNLYKSNILLLLSHCQSVLIGWLELPCCLLIITRQVQLTWRSLIGVGFSRQYNKCVWKPYRLAWHRDTAHAGFCQTSESCMWNQWNHWDDNRLHSVIPLLAHLF